MLRFGPLLTPREGAGPVSGLNKHPSDPSPHGEASPRDRLPDTVSLVKLLGGVCSIQVSIYYCYILDPYIDTVFGRESSRFRKILYPSSPVPL